MANVQFGGLITGLDTNSLISGLIRAEQGPTNILQGQKTVLQAQQGAYTTLVASLADLKTAAQSLSLSSDFNTKTATSSDETVLTASADSTALSGNNAVFVDTLAKAQTIKSATFTGVSDSVGTGTLTFHVGSTVIDIPIDVRIIPCPTKSAINSAGAGVTASIINLGTSDAPDYRLIVQSEETGAANAATVTSTLAGGSRSVSCSWRDRASRCGCCFRVSGLKFTTVRVGFSVIPGSAVFLVKEGHHDGTVSHYGRVGERCCLSRS